MRRADTHQIEYVEEACAYSLILLLRVASFSTSFSYCHPVTDLQNVTMTQTFRTLFFPYCSLSINPQMVMFFKYVSLALYSLYCPDASLLESLFLGLSFPNLY